MTVLVFTSCIDPFSVHIPGIDQLLVVDGMITDQPGPYSVKLLWSSGVENVLNLPNPVEDAQVVIFDDAGNSETLTYHKKGIYRTKVNGIQGTIGRTYHLEIDTKTGDHYASEPEELTSAGTIDSLYFDFKFREKVGSDGVISPANGFDVYLDYKSPGNLLRWRWTGTYYVHTRPELHEDIRRGPPPPNTPILKTPLPCSGYTSPDFVTLVKISDLCTCCSCWYKQYNVTPVISTGEFSDANKLNEVSITFLEAQPNYFFDKYYLLVEQFSLSKNAYEFWKLVKVQQSGGSNLFQPPISLIKGNISGSKSALGIFSACAVVSKPLWMLRTDIPYDLGENILPISCFNLPGNPLGEDTTAVNQPPSFWN